MENNLRNQLESLHKILINPEHHSQKEVIDAMAKAMGDQLGEYLATSDLTSLANLIVDGIQVAVNQNEPKRYKIVLEFDGSRKDDNVFIENVHLHPWQIDPKRNTINKNMN